MAGPGGAKSRNSKQQQQQSRDPRSRSRNTTPLSPGPEPTPTPSILDGESPYLHTSLAALLVPPNASIEALLEKHSSNGNNPPSSASLGALHDGIQSVVLAHVASRGAVCDRAMRELVQKRKERERMEAERHRDEHERLDEERRRKKINGKKRDRDEMEDETRPPTTGAHGLARQDGVDVHMGDGDATSPAEPKPEGTSPASTADLTHQPPPAQTVANYQSFGDDPTQYDDPTVYDIRDLTPDMTREEMKEILCVEEFPYSDLHDLTPGTPPDMDFSSGKSANQVAFNTFMTYLEPYVRPLTEEDVAFLKERGDRLDTFLMPVRGNMHYREVWAREDGREPRDQLGDHLPPNEARGSIEDINDDVAQTEEVSAGPLLSRLLSIFRSTPSNKKKDEAKDEDADANGDITMTNGDSTIDLLGGVGSEETDATRPATFVPDLTGANKPALPPTRNFATLEQRILQEFRYHGLLTPEATPDHDGHFDDEVAARLRYLQSELRTIVAENGARKARVLELTEERMAMQEYSTIADDLDNQINAAYSKRNRTLGKPKKGANKARPGHPSMGVAVSRNSLSEGVRMLMDRRLQWKNLIGPVVEFGQKGIPQDTVFDHATMERLLKAEVDAGDAEDV